MNVCFLFSWEEIFNFPSVTLVNRQNFYEVSSLGKPLTLHFDTLAQSVHLLARDPLFFVFAMLQ